MKWNWLACMAFVFIATESNQIWGQNLELISQALDCFANEKPDFNLLGDQPKESIAMTSLRYVGQARTGSGIRHLFVVQFTAPPAQGRPTTVERVVFFDEKMKFEFAIAIGCGASNVELKDVDGNSVLTLGHRSYGLKGADWKEPLLEQQLFC